jgi:hypothetical protein
MFIIYLSEYVDFSNPFLKNVMESVDINQPCLILFHNSTS